MDKLDQMERMRWSSPSSPVKGPVRLCKFCLLAVLTPLLCLGIPLYMRFQALKPHSFFLSPADMKLLNQESRFSTIWCQSQEVSMNGSFNAYLLSDRPKLQSYRHHVSMRRSMLLEDDIKEFWGFYLLRGSFVRLSVCSRHEGASFILVKGLKDARRCSFLGELDSAEDNSDEFSEEFQFSHELKRLSPSAAAAAAAAPGVRGRAAPTLANPTGQARFKDAREEKERLLAKWLSSNFTVGSDANDGDGGGLGGVYPTEYQALNSLPKKELVRTLLEVIRTRHADGAAAGPTDGDALLKALMDSGERSSEQKRMKQFRAFQRKAMNDTGQRSNVFTDATFLEDISGAEVVDDDVYDLLDRGHFDQHDRDDQSNEETMSSWSSSEEALANCEGLIYNVPLNGGTKCRGNATKKELAETSVEVTLEVKETGFYYFIFANENEMTDNFLSATFDLHKTVFDVNTNAVLNCTNTTLCELPLQFWSRDHVVLEVPAEDEGDEGGEGAEAAGADPCNALQAYSSLRECHRVLMAESVCQPRTVLYMIFLLLVPVTILVFASI